MKQFFYPISLAFITLMPTTLSASNPSVWEIYFENDSIKIEFAYQDCEYIEQFNSEFVIFKTSNFTNQILTLKWEEQLWYDENCINCETDNNESRKQITIPANSTREGKCNENNSLRIFSKFTLDLDKMPGVNRINALTKFELTNLKIK
tara:strand:+ start:179 stop:625 length:447 start_codon:yes stop_codon:yes gene_type:complete